MRKKFWKPSMQANVQTVNIHLGILVALDLRRNFFFLATFASDSATTYVHDCYTRSVMHSRKLESRNMTDIIISQKFNYRCRLNFRIVCEVFVTKLYFKINHTFWIDEGIAFVEWSRHLQLVPPSCTRYRLCGYTFFLVLVQTRPKSYRCLTYYYIRCAA